jgi:hypothetical protein
LLHDYLFNTLVKLMLIKNESTYLRVPGDPQASHMLELPSVSSNGITLRCTEAESFFLTIIGSLSPSVLLI